MTCFDDIFCRHPRDVGMTYTEHMCFSCSLCGKFFCASIQACIHSIFPCAFQTSSTDYSKDISETIETAHNN